MGAFVITKSGILLKFFLHLADSNLHQPLGHYLRKSIYLKLYLNIIHFNLDIYL